MRQRLFLLGAAAVLAAAALLLGGAFRSAGTTSAAGASLPHGVVPTSPAAVQIRGLQSRLHAQPADAGAWAALGLAYEQRARETGDAQYYSKAGGSLRRALRLRPQDLTATTGLGALALSRHRFGEALRLGRVAHRLAPHAAAAYAIVGDALVELGRYRSAFRAFDALSSFKPGLTAYSRIAYGRELIGNTAGAIEAMRLAVDAAASAPEPSAWAHWQLGRLYWSRGRLAAAGREYRAALAVFPGYVFALDALAQVEAARGRIGAAVELERRAVGHVPLPQFAGFLGDLFTRQGKPRLAAEQYGLVAVIQRLLVANGVKNDLETALFRVDHGIRLRDSLRLARLAQRERPSIDGDDVLTWALVRTNRCGEALRYSRRSLRLGTEDALKFFHRGEIEQCLGHPTAARAWFRRALRLNPHFSILWSPVAARAVR